MRNRCHILPMLTLTGLLFGLASSAAAKNITRAEMKLLQELPGEMARVEKMIKGTFSFSSYSKKNDHEVVRQRHMSFYQGVADLHKKYEPLIKETKAGARRDVATRHLLMALDRAAAEIPNFKKDRFDPFGVEKVGKHIGFGLRAARSDLPVVERSLSRLKQKAGKSGLSAAEFQRMEQLEKKQARLEAQVYSYGSAKRYELRNMEPGAKYHMLTPEEMIKKLNHQESELTTKISDIEARLNPKPVMKRTIKTLWLKETAVKPRPRSGADVRIDELDLKDSRRQLQQIRKARLKQQALIHKPKPYVSKGQFQYRVWLRKRANPRNQRTKLRNK